MSHFFNVPLELQFTQGTCDGFHVMIDLNGFVFRCTISMNALTQAAEVCKEIATVADRIADIKLRYCVCLKGALHKNLPC
jgi:hypothetical protein